MLAARRWTGVNIADDGKIDLRFIAWVRVGTVRLEAGRHRVAFKMHSDNNHHGMLDCLVFTDEAFTPEGTRKPGEESDARIVSAEGRWAFQPPRDAFSPDALLDLRSLNEAVAGEHGFISRSKDGADFAFADGTPVRFWAVVDSAYDKDLARHARFLAKRGVNMVRFHCNITPRGSDLMEIDQAERDRVWKGVAAMKKEGIYVTFSPYWAGPARVNPAMGVLDTAGGGNWGLLFFDQKLPHDMAAIGIRPVCRSQKARTAHETLRALATLRRSRPPAICGGLVLLSAESDP